MDWKRLRTEILLTFTPGPPINEVAQFAGRKSVIQRLQDIAIERARHAIIFGERGVGKTSLANVFYKDLNSPTRIVREIPVDADSGDSFDSLWRKVFRRIKWPADEYSLDSYFPQQIEPDHVYLELAKFGLNELPIIILDEYDRIKDEDCRILMTDLIKATARLRNNTTIVLVGVADNILQLIRDHASIHRNLAQVPMHRMEPDEIREIIVSRVRQLRIRITDDAVWRISYFSSGLPFYAHSLGKYSAIRAAEHEAIQITENTVLTSLVSCMNDVDYSIQESYTRATERIYRKDNIFRQVLAACALAETNDLGEFAAIDVEGPLSAIMKTQYKVPAFAFHLNELATPARGNVLVKSGTRKTFRYNFTEPAMQPYIVMKSLDEKVIPKETYDQLRVKRQKSLSI
jgi:AAA domain-containing protein